MASNSDIAHAWAHNKGPKKGSSVFREDNAIYSWGHHWIMGVNVENSFYFLSERYGSPSTSKHEGHVSHSIPHGATRIDGIKQSLLKSINYHASQDTDSNWGAVERGLMAMAQEAIADVIKLLRTKPHIAGAGEYEDLPRRVERLLDKPMEILDAIMAVSAKTGWEYNDVTEDIVAVYRRALIATMEDKSRFLPYGLDILLNAMPEHHEDEASRRMRISFNTRNWEWTYPGYREKLAELRVSSANRSNAAGGPGWSNDWRRPKTEEDWNKWYAYSKDFKTNDSEGFTRLRLLKSNKSRVQTSLGVSMPLDSMRLALVAYDRGIDELPRVSSTVGTFGASRIHRNGSDETSYVVYGCHKVRIAEARKVLS